MTYPFSFENGKKIMMAVTGEAGEEVAGQEQVVSPSEMIREELKLREERGELTHDKSPLLIKLTSLYKVTIFETKPQMFPGSATASAQH